MQTVLSPFGILNSPLGGGIVDFIKASFSRGFTMIDEGHYKYVMYSRIKFTILSFYGDDKLLANNDSGLLVSTGEVVVLSNCDEGHW